MIKNIKNLKKKKKKREQGLSYGDWRSKKQIDTKSK